MGSRGHSLRERHNRLHPLLSLAYRGTSTLVPLHNWPHNFIHSLRRGFATEAARLGAPMAAIQRHGRWQCTRTVIEYIEAGRQFTDSAVKVLFDF